MFCFKYKSGVLKQKQIDRFLHTPLKTKFSSLRIWTKINPLCNAKEHGNRMWKRWTSPLKRNKACGQIFLDFEVRKNYNFFIQFEKNFLWYHIEAKTTQVRKLLVQKSNKNIQHVCTLGWAQWNLSCFEFKFQDFPHNIRIRLARSNFFVVASWRCYVSALLAVSVTSGQNKTKFWLGQSYLYIMRKVWYHQIWIQNNFGFMESDLMYLPTFMPYNTLYLKTWSK